MSDGASSEDKGASKPEWFRGFMAAVPFAVVLSLTLHNVALGVSIAATFAVAFATAFGARKCR